MSRTALSLALTLEELRGKQTRLFGMSFSKHLVAVRAISWQGTSMRSTLLSRVSESLRHSPFDESTELILT
jgi:hypothetical protein